MTRFLNANRVPTSLENALYRLACLQEAASGNLQAAVGLPLKRIERLPCFAVGVDDVDALRDRAVRDACLAELETLVTVDRRIALLDHQHEDLGLREDALDRGRRVGIGRRRIVAAEGFSLRSYDALRGSNVIRGASG